MSSDYRYLARSQRSTHSRRSVLKASIGAGSLALIGGRGDSASASAQNPATPSPTALGGYMPEAPAYDLPLAEPGSTTFTVATNDNYYAPRSYTENLPVWAEIEARTGVAIDWQVTPGDEYDDVISVRIGAASDMPDFFGLPWGMEPITLGADGLILPLNDLIDKQAPSIKAFLDEFPNCRRMMTAPDGNIYAIPSVASGAGVTDPYGVLVRQDWLDAIGIEQPVTLEEWHDALQRFKTEILEANGVTDVAPMMGGNGGLNALLTFGNALGLKMRESLGWVVNDEGKVEWHYIDDRLKTLLGWISTLYTEKLLDQRFHQTTKEDRIQLVTTGNVGVDVDFLNRAGEWNRTQAQAGIEGAMWTTATPPASDAVPNPYYETYSPLGGWFAMSSSHANPELGMKWLDYIWASDEGNTLVTYGLEGTTYTAAADGRLQFTEWVTANPDGLDPVSALRYHGAFPTTPWVRASGGSLSGFAEDLIAITPEIAAISQKIAPYLIPPFPLIQATKEESDEIASITADLYTYFAEQLHKLALGQVDLDEGWDDYLATTDSLGIQRMIEIRQQQYDRFMTG